MWKIVAVFLLVQGLAFASSFKVKGSDCAKLVAHKPAAGVEYKPGEGVKGKKVASADVNGGYNLAMPEEVTINLNFDLNKKYGVPANSNLYVGEGQVGKITVDKSGKALFNGQPISKEDEAQIALGCQKSKGN